MPIHTEAGRTDVQRSTSDFTFKPAIKSAFHNFTIVDDDVLEFDELFIAEFDFGPQLSKIWNVNKGEPSVLFCLIRDDDCEWHTQICKNGRIHY